MLFTTRDAAMIFPGMDPYLENPAIWPGVHASLIVYIRDQLQPLLQPKYWATIEERVFVEAPTARDFVPDVHVKHRRPGPVGSTTAMLEPDVAELIETAGLEIRERFIEIVAKRNGRKVVTVLEGLSPYNKATGPGRDAYLAKQAEVVASDAHLVEID